MNTRQRLLLKDIYLMQPDDISRFTATLADVFPYSSTSAAESTTMTRWAYSGHCRLPFCQIMPSALPVAKRHQTANDGYLMAFATRIDKLEQHYGKPLIEALLSYLDASGEGSI